MPRVRVANGTPLQYSCLENPMDGGAWRAAVHGVAKSRTRLSDFTFTFSHSCIGEGNGNPLQCSCLEDPRGRRSWWADVYGVTQSWTRLKWLSSSMVFVFLYLMTSFSITIFRSIHVAANDIISFFLWLSIFHYIYRSFMMSCLIFKSLSHF